MTNAQVKTGLTSNRIDSYSLAAALTRAAPNAGALVTFAGHVRQEESVNPVIALELEHYPARTEQDLAELAQQAVQQWALQAAWIVHRVGRIPVRECVVWVGVASAHRAAAYAANEFIMDALKTRVMLWKRECRAQGAQWLNATRDDQARVERWEQ